MRIRIREPFNGLSHIFAAIAALIGLGFLLYWANGGILHRISLLIYGISLVCMFSASAAYHSIQAGKKLSIWLRKLDHSAIYLLIAGTYTPVCLYFFEGFWRYGILIVIWAIAVTGITLKLLIINTPRGLTAGIYIVMGWISIIGIPQIIGKLPAGALIWLITGGVLFTTGAVIYIIKKPNLFSGRLGFHEVWHIFVILGALSHYIMVAGYIAS